MGSLKMIGLGKLKQGLYHLDIIKSQTSPMYYKIQLQKQTKETVMHRAKYF